MVQIPESIQLQQMILDKQAEIVELQHKKAVAEAKEYKQVVEMQVKNVNNRGPGGLHLPGQTLN